MEKRKNTKTARTIKSKENIKSKNNTKKKTTSKKVTKTPIKRRVNKKISKQEKNIKLALMIAFIALIIFCYLTLDLTFAVLTAIGIGTIVGIAEILKKMDKHKKKLKIVLTIFLVLGIVALISCAGFMFYIKKEADPMFVSSKLETPENTTLLDITGKEYAKLGAEMREKITYDELPEVLVDAIIATEDSRFFQHNGFDAPRFIVAAVGQAMGKSDAGGASTLSMQVVKNSLTDAKAVSGIDGIMRKFKDIYLAVFKLEKNYTKEEIIEYYVNNHYLGGNVYGVQEAAETYFGKSVSELNLSEAAILAGMFKSPVYYRPTDHPENATKRRSTVLYLMRKHGYITKEEEALAKSIPVESLVIDNAVNKNSEFQGYIDTVVKEIEDKYGINAYTTPLLVYTNLDIDKQRAVNSVFNGESYEWINDKIQSGAAVLDSHTGKILAIGNGRNIGSRSANKVNQLNYATSIKRQPGSTAKPLFDYGPGIEYNNWSTYTLFTDEPYTYSTGQRINNWDGKYFGTITLRRALATSRNIPALKAFQQVDNAKIVEFVTKLGLSPEIEGGKVHEAHAIGAFTGTNPLEMSAAYAAFSNGGYYNEPYSVSKIVYKTTGEEKEHKSESVKVMSDATAFMISSVLQDVSLTGGTPKNVACKTGTTNYDKKTMTDNNLPSDAIRDSWVVGYSTKTVIGMWYGYDFIDSEYCSRNIPATIQKDKLFIALVNSGAMEGNREEFKKPDSVEGVRIENGTNPPKLASPNSNNAVYEYFKKDHVPEETYEEAKIEKPKNFKASYSNITKKVTLSWGSVPKPNMDDKNLGAFGYNIYFNDTLIDFTEKTYYSYSPTTTPYGTYKIVAGYKGYSKVKSEEATYTLKDKNKEEENPNDKENDELANATLTYKGVTKLPANGSLILNSSDFEVTTTEGDAKIISCSPTQISTAGTHVISCTVEHNEKKYTLATTVSITKDEHTQ